MEYSDKIELIAAYVNYYKYYNKEIDYQAICEELKEHFNSANEVKRMYENNYSVELDQIFLVDRVIDLRIKEKKIYVVVKWLYFPIDFDDPQNFLDVENISLEFVEQYCKENVEKVQKEIDKLPAEQKSKYLRYFKDSAIMCYFFTAQSSKQELAKQEEPPKEDMAKKTPVESPPKTTEDGSQPEKKESPKIGFFRSIEVLPAYSGVPRNIQSVAVIQDSAGQFFFEFSGDGVITIYEQELVVFPQLQLWLNEYIVSNYRESPVTRGGRIAVKDRLYSARELQGDTQAQRMLNWQICVLASQEE